MQAGAYNLVEKAAKYSPYPTTLSIIEFLRLVWREESPPAREITVTGLDTLLASLPGQEQPQMAAFIHDCLQDVANMMGNRRQTVQFVLQGKIDHGEFYEVRQLDGQYVNLSAIFGTRLHQEANDWLVASLWV